MVIAVYPVGFVVFEKLYTPFGGLPRNDITISMFLPWNLIL